MKRGKKDKSIKVDLSGVEDGFKLLPEGNYNVSLEEASVETSDKSGGDYIKMTFEISEGKSKGQKLWHNCSLQPQALFNLKAVLSAMGFEIPKKSFDLDVNDLIGLECIVEVAHEKYQGKTKAKIVEFINPEDDEDEEDDDIEDLLAELSVDQLKELAKELGSSSSDLKKLKKADQLIDHIMDEYDERSIQSSHDELFSEEEDDDDDDEDYEDMSLPELKEECKDRGLKFSKKATKEDLIELLEEDDE